MNKVVSKILLLFITAMMLLQFAMPMTVQAAEWGDDFGINYTQNGIEKGNAYGGNSDQADVWNKIFGEYKGIIVGITGIGTLTMVALFIFNVMKLGQSAGNPQARRADLTGLLWTGLAAAGLGGVTIFVGFSQNLLKG